MFSKGIIRRTLRHSLLASACLGIPALSVAAQEQHEHATPASAAESYGRVHFPVSCSPQAQQRFDQAVAMLHSFHFPATVKAFTAITATEPDCAMARWGVAISQRRRASTTRAQHKNTLFFIATRPALDKRRIALCIPVFSTRQSIPL